MLLGLLGLGAEEGKSSSSYLRKVIEAKISGKHEIEIWGDGNKLVRLYLLMIVLLAWKCGKKVTRTWK